MYNKLVSQWNLLRWLKQLTLSIDISIRFFFLKMKRHIHFQLNHCAVHCVCTHALTRCTFTCTDPLAGIIIYGFLHSIRNSKGTRTKNIEDVEKNNDEKHTHRKGNWDWCECVNVALIETTPNVLRPSGYQHSVAHCNCSPDINYHMPESKCNRDQTNALANWGSKNSKKNTHGKR